MADTYTGAMPGQDAYGLYANQAKTAYETALTRIQDQRGQLLRQSGLSQGADGKLSALSDTPYGGYQQMLQGNAQDAEQVQAANHGGFGFSGGGVGNARARAAQRLAGQRVNDFGIGVNQGLTGLYDQQQQVGQDYNNQLANLLLQQTQQGIQDGAFNPGQVGTGPDGGYGSTAPGPASTPSAPPAPWRPPTRRNHRRGRR